MLQRRLRQRGTRAIAQVLVQWSNGSEDQATWEDMEQLRQRFPAAPAWGQAGIQGEGIVSDLDPPSRVVETNTEAQDRGPSEGRPKRTKRAPAWMVDGTWTA